jgi:hypothetical protein
MYCLLCAFSFERSVLHREEVHNQLHYNIIESTHKVNILHGVHSQVFAKTSRLYSIPKGAYSTTYCICSPLVRSKGVGI